MVQKLTVLFVVILILLSCTAKKESRGSTSAMEKNQIEINVQNNKRENTATDPDSALAATPLPKQTHQPEENDFFLSGRTELLSVYSQGFISAEGFTIGELFVYNTASAAEREIIEICRKFFQSFDSKEVNSYVDPPRQLEILDYYNHFFHDKIVVSEYLLGKPVILGRDAVVEIIFFPKGIPAYLYLTTKETRWRITGLEADLRNKDREVSVDKWAPSMSSLQLGGY